MVNQTQQKTQQPGIGGMQQPNIVHNLISELNPEITLFREKEQRRILEILGKNIDGNVMIVGDSGVGKSNLVKGVSKKIKDILGYNVIELTPHPLFHLIQSKAQFDEKVLNVFNSIQTIKNSILFIDNFDLCFTEYKGNELEFDLLLSIYLEKNIFKTIVTVSKEEYGNLSKAYIGRFFEPVFIEELEPKQINEILKTSKDYYEETYEIKINNKILEKVSVLSNRFITEFKNPLSSLNVLESACSHLKHNTMSEFDEKQLEILNEIKSKISEAEDNKMLSVQKKDFNKAAMFKEQQNHAQSFYFETLEKFKKTNNKVNKLTEDHIRNVISEITKIPVNKLNSDNLSKLRTLDKDLQVKIVNQNEGIDTLTRAIKRNSVGIRDQKKPIGVFLFVGPTGTGKTYLTKVLAENYYTSEKDIVRLDMSEYSDKIAINKLLGSSPGYIGYEEGGILTRAVQEKPHSIVLLDEIEKAHPLVFNTLLQVFDEGHMSDNKGRQISFKNNIIIMTSNVGCHTANKKIQIEKVGFNKQLAKLEKIDDFKKVVQDEIKKIFPPEFINRIDDVIYFNKLENEHLQKIILLEIKKISERMRDNDYKIIFERGIEERIMEFNKEKINADYGAREIKRILLQFEDSLTDSIIEEKIKTGKVKIDFKNKYEISNY